MLELRGRNIGMRISGTSIASCSAGGLPLTHLERQDFTFRVDVQLYESDDGWHARLSNSPDLDIAGSTRGEVLENAKALALRTLAERADREAADAARQSRVVMDIPLD